MILILNFIRNLNIYEGILYCIILYGTIQYDNGFSSIILFISAVTRGREIHIIFSQHLGKVSEILQGNGNSLRSIFQLRYTLYVTLKYEKLQVQFKVSQVRVLVAIVLFNMCCTFEFYDYTRLVMIQS